MIEPPWSNAQGQGAGAGLKVEMQPVVSIGRSIDAPVAMEHGPLELGRPLGLVVRVERRASVRQLWRVACG